VSEIGLQCFKPVLATNPIRPLNQAFKHTFTCLSQLAASSEEEDKRNAFICSFSEGEIDALHGILTFIKRLTGLCLQSLHHRFRDWTKPDTAPSLMVGVLTDFARSKSELVAENALCWLLEASAEKMEGLISLVICAVYSGHPFVKTAFEKRRDRCQTGSEIVFDSQKLADKEEKGDQSTRSKRDEKKPPSDAHDAGSDRLSLRSHGCAMGSGATLGSSDCPRCRLSGA
jgi:hypothetical protein